MGRFNQTNWRLMLIERKRLQDQEKKFSMCELLSAHHISTQWAKFISPAIAFFAKQKRSEQVPMPEFFAKVKELYEKAQEVPEVIATKEEITNPLEKVSLEDLISEINRRGFKVFQA